MKEKAKVCAILPGMETVYVPFFKEQSNLLKELEKKCNVEIMSKETRQASKETYDWILQGNPNAYIESNENNKILDYIEKNKKDLEGLIIFPDGFIDKRFLFTGLPTLFVDTLPNLQIEFKNATALGKRYKTKFITATFNSLNTDVSETVSKAREKDLVEKVQLFNAIKRMKDTRIMDVQVKGCGTEPHEHWWRLNQEEYLQELKESTGIEVVIADYRDLFKVYQDIDLNQAKSIAEKWVKEAKPTKAIRNKRSAGKVTEEEVIKAAKLYLAAEKMMNEEGCNAITVDATSWAAPVGKEFAKTIGEDYLVSSSLALTEFRLHGIPTCCQSDMEGLVTQIMGEAISNRPGFHGDFIVDPFNQIAQIGHCNAPINPYGDDRRFAYSIGGEKERRPQVYVDLPQEGPVTVFKANVLEKKISLWGGELIPGETIYKNFFEAYCCSKLSVKTEAKRIYDNYNYRTFGNHNCLFYGEFREKIKFLAKLIGFDVIEQDK
jgi:L-fucose isomerase-like protein